MTKATKLQLGVALWIIGILGVGVLTLTVVPQLLRSVPTTVPEGVLIAVSLVQSGVLLALAVWLGVALSPSLGLGAPVTTAVLARSGAWQALRPQLVPGMLAGLASGIVLLIAVRYAPPEILAAGAKFRIPASARLLYGGITEEILMRWGLMTLFAWLAWRFLQKRQGAPRPAFFITAILVAALLFAIGHLPAVAAMQITLSPEVLAFVLLGNAIPGILFGIAYWRRGLECAFLAHAVAHLVAILGGAT